MCTTLIPFLEMNGMASDAFDFYVKALDAKVVFILPTESSEKNETGLPTGEIR